MDEEKTTETEKSEDAEENSGDGDKSSTDELIKRQSAKIEELEKERSKRIEADAKKQLGGFTEAGQSPVVKKEEDTPEEYVKKVMNGEIGDEKS